MLKLVLFDIAGTTVRDDNYVSGAFLQAFWEHGVEVKPGDVDPLMGYHKPEAIRRVLEMYQIETDGGLVASIHDLFEKEMIRFYQHSPNLQALEGAVESLLLLKELKVPAALNTGFSRIVAQTILDRLEWQERGWIAGLIASDEVPRGRPHPDMINELMKRFQLNDPRTVMKIGDTPVDIQEGKNAGCGWTIAVSTGAASRAELEPHEPDMILDSLKEFPACINNIFQNEPV